MADGILSTLFGKPSVSIQDQLSGAKTALNLKVLKVSINLSAEPQRHMLEDGTTLVDTRTIKPIRVSMDAICPDIDTLIQMNNIIQNRDTRYKVSTRGIVLPDMRAEGATLRQSAEMLTATPIRISFKQLLIQNNNPQTFKNPADSSLINRGIAAISSAAGAVSDLYGKAVTSVSNLVG